jgi:hypothetical protein
MSPLSSGLKKKSGKKPAWQVAISYLLYAGFLSGLFFSPEYGGYMFLRNVGWLSTDYTTLYPRR